MDLMDRYQKRRGDTPSFYTVHATTPSVSIQILTLLFGWISARQYRACFSRSLVFEIKRLSGVVVVVFGDN